MKGLGKFSEETGSQRRLSPFGVRIVQARDVIF